MAMNSRYTCWDAAHNKHKTRKNGKISPTFAIDQTLFEINFLPVRNLVEKCVVNRTGETVGR